MKKVAAVLLAVALVSSSALAGTVEFSKGEYNPNDPGLVLLDVTVMGDAVYDFADILFASREDGLALVDFNFSPAWTNVDPPGAFSNVFDIVLNPLGMLPTELFSSSTNATPVGPTLVMGQLVVDLSAMELTKDDIGTQLEVFTTTQADTGFIFTQVGFNNVNEEIPGIGIINVTPEPATMALLGLASLAMIRRRKSA